MRSASLPRQVLLFGRAEILEAGPDRGRAFALLGEKYPRYRATCDFGDGPVIGLTPERVVSWSGGAWPARRPADPR